MSSDSQRASPRVTFGIIVLNGEPFTRYCLRSLYPFAHQIIVVEGGHHGRTPLPRQVVDHVGRVGGPHVVERGDHAVQAQAAQLIQGVLVEHGGFVSIGGWVVGRCSGYQWWP